MLTFRKFAERLAVLLSLSIVIIPHCHAQQKKQQKGKASYYSRKASGFRTSSGERLNNDSLVCAHRTHPFGTKLLVKNPANGKEIIVRVIDRGPFGRGRIIDLSYEAARQLGMLSAGVAMVEVSVYDDTAIPFKPKDYSAPELELEFNDGGNPMTPAWQHKKQENKHKTYENAVQNHNEHKGGEHKNADNKLKDHKTAEHKAGEIKSTEHKTNEHKNAEHKVYGHPGAEYSIITHGVSEQKKMAEQEPIAEQKKALEQKKATTSKVATKKPAAKGPTGNNKNRKKRR